jgi:hypothetical protein
VSWASPSICRLTRLLTIVASRLEYPHTLLHRSACESLVIWRNDGRKQGDVDTERLVRESPGLADRRAQRIRRRLTQRGQYALMALMSSKTSKDANGTHPNHPRWRRLLRAAGSPPCRAVGFRIEFTQAEQLTIAFLPGRRVWDEKGGVRSG